MCEDDDDLFYRDPDDSCDHVAWCGNSGEFRPDDQTWILFNVEMTPNQLLLANALLDIAFNLDSAIEVMKAAFALREFTGVSAAQPSEEARQWNACYEKGQLVQYWPGGRNGESFLTRTTSPAIDTHQGPVVLVEMSRRAVSLLNVEPRRLTIRNGEV